MAECHHPPPPPRGTREGFMEEVAFDLTYLTRPDIVHKISSHKEPGMIIQSTFGYTQRILCVYR